ncbi:hypothetical protein AhyVDH1_005 [Aeromonas phage AhyVDH1]|nr:hypothetical protein AhyVDH1_005 [Aeromonas phage AhyVDH1]
MRLVGKLMQGMIKKLPKPVAEFLLQRVMLGLLVIGLALAVSVIVPIIMALVCVMAIFDPLRAIDLIDRTGQELAK